MEIPTVESSMLVLIDLQQKLVPAMSEPESTVVKSALLLRGAGELGLDVLVSEQYPQGLGNTVPELAELFTENTPVIAKTSFSCFGEEEFVKAMDIEKRPVLIICGIESHVCVAQTALDALNAGYKVFIASDAVNSRKNSDKETALAFLRHAGCNVISSEAILFMLLKTAKNPAFKAVSKLVR